MQHLLRSRSIQANQMALLCGRNGFFNDPPTPSPESNDCNENTIYTFSGFLIPKKLAHATGQTDD